MTGTITKLIKKDDNRKTDEGGYGFIKDEEGQDRFFHARNLMETKFEKLREGLKVEFVPVEVEITSSAKGSRNGRRAESVKVIA